MQYIMETLHWLKEHANFKFSHNNRFCKGDTGLAVRVVCTYNVGRSYPMYCSKMLQNMSGLSLRRKIVKAIRTCLLKYLHFTYNGGSHLNVYKYFFMNCQIQISMAQYRNVATPLGFWGISTIHQHFQMMNITLF